MIYLIALIFHLFGVHSPQPYDSFENFREGEFRCMICKGIFKEEP